MDRDMIIGAVVGVIVTALLSQAGYSLRYVWRRLKKNQLEGRWHEYHWSFKDSCPVLVKGLWDVKKGFRTEFAVCFVHQPKRDLCYVGDLFLENGHQVIRLKAKTHAETLFYRFQHPIPSSDNLIPGIWLSYDHNEKITAGAALLSRTELSEGEAIAFLKGRTYRGQGIPVMRIV